LILCRVEEHLVEFTPFYNRVVTFEFFGKVLVVKDKLLKLVGFGFLFEMGLGRE
jgi:hypothetical protein